MPRFVLFEALFILLLLVASLTGAISFARTGQVLIGIAVIDFVLALLSHFGWPVLRGDVSDLSPLSRQDTFEMQGDRYASKPFRPSRSFVTGLVSMGIIALGIGILLILLMP